MTGEKKQAWEGSNTSGFRGFCWQVSLWKGRPMPSCTRPSAHAISLSLGTVSLALGSLPLTRQKRILWEILLSFCTSVACILKRTQKDQGFHHNV